MSKGGGGSSSGSQTTRVEPPAYQLPYLQSGLRRAEGLYNAGQSVIPFSPQSEQALGLTEQRALAGSPVTRGAQDYFTRTISGGFMGSNPYLDATFNKAALATQNQLASEFARSGRNIGASEPLRAQQLNDLATSLYGGDYQAERDRMQGVLPYATGLANQDYVDIGQLRGVGQDVEGLAREYTEAPGNQLDQYLARVSGSMGETRTTPMYRNRAAGVLGGAATGYDIGSGIGSGYGGYGAILGGILGGM